MYIDILTLNMHLIWMKIAIDLDTITTAYFMEKQVWQVAHRYIT